MPCGCKKRRKRGSGGLLGRSSATWAPLSTRKRGRGVNFSGGGYKKKRRKRGSGVNFSGSGVNFSGGGVVFDGSGFKTLVGYHRRSK